MLQYLFHYLSNFFWMASLTIIYEVYLHCIVHYYLSLLLVDPIDGDRLLVSILDFKILAQNFGILLSFNIGRGENCVGSWEGASQEVWGPAGF